MAARAASSAAFFAPSRASLRPSTRAQSAVASATAFWSKQAASATRFAISSAFSSWPSVSWILAQVSSMR
jgi:hypothetical protein